MTTISVLQPSYLPWVGYIQLIADSDVFVYYDSVQYDKHGWRNRNRILTDGQVKWITVPVLTNGKHKQAIKDVLIHDKINWRRKHLGQLLHSYKKAKFFFEIYSMLDDCYKQKILHISDLNIFILKKIMRYLNITTEIYRSSSLEILGDRNQRLVNICKNFNGTKYISGVSAKNYLDLDLFEKNNIEVVWQKPRIKPYAQLSNQFIPSLSVIDMLFHNGKDSINFILE